MKLRYNFLLVGVIILLAAAPLVNTLAQDNDRLPGRENRKPKAWPKQRITQKTVQVSPAHVINFQHLADYEKAHPVPPRSKFIEQGEDKDEEFRFPPHKIPHGTPVYDPNHLSSNRGENTHQTEKSLHQEESPAPTGYFYGTNENSNAQVIPPDVDGAAGPSYVMETNNYEFAIYTKGGTLWNSVSINSFFSGGQSDSYFDPHILYDNNYSRFIVVIDGNVSNGDGGLFIAVSETSDPNGNWYTYSIDDGDGNQSDLLDYPELGYNNNWVVITANDFVGNGNPVGDIYVLDRATLYNGTFTASTAKLFTDNNAFSWAPAQTFDLSEDTLWMVQDGNGGNGAMQIGCITGTVATPVYNAGNNIAVTQKWNENAIDVGQEGSTQLINDDDDRVYNGSVYINGTLWFTHTVYLPSGGNPSYSGVDWWQIVPSSLTLKQFGRIADNNGNTNYYYPSLNVNANGDALLGYCLSGTDSFYPSAGYSFHAASDPVNSMESRYIFKKGQNYYYETLGGGRNRYGDYTGTAVDPNDQSFWNFSEWPDSINTSTWGIVIAHVAASVAPTSPPVANFIANDTAFTCNGLVQFTDLSTNIPTSWLWNFGDGTTSTLQNPSHQYTANGTYTVTLKATNAYGTGTQTFTSYIVIDLAAGPTAANVSHCGASSFSLSASTTNKVGWFDSTGTLVSSSNPFVTPVLNHTTTYWVQDTVPASIDSVGPATYTSLGTGGIFTNTNQHYLQFDALSNFTLISVLVDASTSGTRTIQLLNSGGTVLATATPNIPTGVSVVALNFAVPAGTAYELALAGTVNLYRNNGGATNGNTNYFPITLPGIVSITGSDAGAGYYYYFYNWKVKGPSCVSAQTPVSAVISSGSLSITPSISEVACYGQATGSVALTVSGGTPNYTYNWSNSQTGSSVTNLVAGTYKVTVTDAGGCTTTATETVTQPTAALSVSPNVTNVACHGASTGAVNLTVAGGTAAYSYLWSGGSTSHNLTGVTAGTYSVTVTDARSCSASASAQVTQNSAITVSATPVNTGCGTSATGSVTASAAGGTSVYSYRWSNGQTAITAINLAAGPYTVTVTDSAGCTASASATVAQNSSNLSISPGVTNANCFGAASGTIDITISGGTSGYTYNWSTGSTSHNLTNITAGTYSVTVTDANSCTASDSITVGQPTAVTGVTSAVNSGCGVSSSGSASVVALGGTPGYTYQWSNNETTDTISNLAGGTFVVTITDSHTCTGTASAVVSNSGSLSLNISSAGVQCYGFSNGSASVTETGGTGNITYAWSNGGSSSSIFNLTAGTYTVTVSDIAGCNNIASTTVTGPSAALSVNLTPSPAACGVSNGSVNAAPSGGTPAYSYHWNTGASTRAIGGLGGGFYSVTVTDDSLCTATGSALVVSSSSLLANLTSTSATCHGVNNGGASVTVTSGTAPYTYLWNTGGTGNSISNLYAGTYYVTIIDSFGCQSADSVVVNQPGSITVIVNVSQPTCNGVLTGSASVNVAGGTPGYTYAWSDNSTDSSVTALAAGNYSVSVLDSKGCSATAQLSIQTISDVTATLTSANDSCYGAHDGSAQVTPSGGSNPYTYLWSNGDTSSSVSDLVAGNLTVTVTDNNHCSASATGTVSQPDEITISVSSTNAVGGQSNGSATVDSVAGGTVPYVISWNDGQSGNTITNLGAGTYTVTVTDHNGCQQTAGATVNKVSGIMDVTGAPNFDLYPNPAGTQVVVEMQLTSNEARIWLKNVLGQTLYNSPISSVKTTIDLSSYANGIYFVEVNAGHSTAIRKLIIDR